MKNFFYIVIAAFFTFTLFAGEKAVLQANKEYIQAIMNLDAEKVLSFCHPGFLEINNGQTAGYGHVKKGAWMMKTIRDGIEGKAPLADMMELFSFAKKEKFTPEMRKKYQEMENTPEGTTLKTSMQMVMLLGKSKAEADSREFRESWKYAELLSCNVNGSKAEVIFLKKDSGGTVIENCKNNWVKLNGKWLIKKSVTAKVEEKVNSDRKSGSAASSGMED